MKGLLKILPPFSPDYSGVCSALFELDGLVVIQDAAGCTGNFTCYDEPRWYGSSSAIFSSELREIDAVLGDDEKFINRLRDAISKLNRKFVAIIGSPAPMVIGTDYRAIAGIIAKKTGLPVLYFDTNGIDSYEKGASMAYLAIAQNLLIPNKSKNQAKVNILGATPLDYSNGKQIEELIQLLKLNGFEINSTWGMKSNLDEISASLNAALNIVVSWTGLAAARYMEKEYEIPFIAGLPVGRTQAGVFLDKLHKREIRDIPFKCKSLDSVLIIGEQILSNALREALLFDSDYSRIKVASFFEMDSQYTVDGDVKLDSESDFRRLINENHFDIVIGDPLYKGFFNRNDKLFFLSIPHVAVSSRLFWSFDYSLIGGKWLDLLKENDKFQLNNWVEMAVYRDLTKKQTDDIY